jgi:hypothetical protein
MSSVQGANSPEKVLKSMGMAFWTAIESESDIDTGSDWIGRVVKSTESRGGVGLRWGCRRLREQSFIGSLW